MSSSYTPLLTKPLNQVYVVVEHHSLNQFCGAEPLNGPVKLVGVFANEADAKQEASVKSSRYLLGPTVVDDNRSRMMEIDYQFGFDTGLFTKVCDMDEVDKVGRMDTDTDDTPTFHKYV